MKNIGYKTNRWRN